MRACLCLYVGSSCLPPLSLWEDATPPPTAFLVDLGIDLVLPDTFISAGSVTDLPLGISLASASWALCPRYIYLSSLVPFYVLFLRAPGSLPLFEGMTFVAGQWVG